MPLGIHAINTRTTFNINKYNYTSTNQLHSIYIQLHINKSTTFNIYTITHQQINYIQYIYTITHQQINYIQYNKSTTFNITNQLHSI